ncbi:AMP-binding protein [Rhodococcus sp. W8901]|uniref:AMP-binding protein n=1 Tax=Rhodococcus sp. W8901 TaxID=2742603 RepID=UPI0020C6E0C8|nr:AMP-binding protein [Rhodococcus sp. W8901]
MASLLEYSAGPGRLRDDRLVRGTDGLLRYTGLTSSLTELLDVAAHRFGSREAVVEVGGARLTHAQLWTSASRVAGGLLQQGIDIGDRVAIRMPNGARWVQAFLGVLLAGGVPVPIHPGHGVEETRHIMADSGSVLVLDGELPQGVRSSTTVRDPTIRRCCSIPAARRARRRVSNSATRTCSRRSRR